MRLRDWPIFTASTEADWGRCAAKHLHYRQARKHCPRLRIIATL